MIEAVEEELRPLIWPPIGFAHRGAKAHAPENTIEAFSLARRLGATGLETDVWLSADGAAVIDHDGFASGGLRRRRIADVARADLPEHMPTLSDVYDACGADLPLSIDVCDAAAIDAIVAAAREVAAEDRLWLCHPDWEVLASWRTKSPLMRLVHSTRLKRLDGGPERHMARLREAGVDAVNLHFSEWTGGLTALVHRFELYALAWDAQFDRVLDETLAMGVDGIFSDHVDLMMDAIARVSAT
jgi:glycerophosphoryl diester phosphodiesterase